jgi:ABC-type Fe3+/spermidine/putrescine transport system ATPase subunit
MDARVLEFRGVTKRFPSHTAVDEISLSIDQGAFFSLLGPSGCGKTTTLRLAAGFEQPDSGDVFLNGVRINGLRPYERNVSTVFQNYALFPHLTVRGNIEFGLRRKRADAIDQAVRDVLELVQLAGKESRKPSEISGGERQRVALARSLVLAPDVLLLDEPLSALDPNLRKQMRAELKSVQRRAGVTFLFVTHDQEEALSLSDRIAVMNRGRIEQTGTPPDIYLRPCTRFVAGFLGAMNWYDGIGIRPESTRVSRETPAGPVRAIAATVQDAVFLGNCLHIETRLESGERMVSEVPRTAETFAPGDNVQVWWHAADELRFPLDVQ